MSYWNYRIIRRHHKEIDTETFQIHEVYYDDEHQVESWTAGPIDPTGETLLELKGDVELMLKAFEQPVLVEKIVNGKETLVEKAAGLPRE